MQDPTPYGSYATIEDRPALRFERRLRHPAEAVWRAVTDPDELSYWFPARITGDLEPGGRMTFTFPGDAFPPSEGEVKEYDPPHRFAFSWGEEDLRFEIEPDGDGSILRFTHVLEARDAAARDAAGWHVCLDKLDERLAGGAPEAPGTEPTPEHDRLYAEYERRGLPTGAPMPG
jgi:uncharacterized protein YndB with AHSA1/START domain